MNSYLDGGNPYLDDGDIDHDVRDCQVGRYLDDPMPRELNDHIGSYIEPTTMNTYTKHSDVMDAIHVAWPVIRDYLRDHPDVLAAGDTPPVNTREGRPWSYPDS